VLCWWPRSVFWSCCPSSDRSPTSLFWKTSVDTIGPFRCVGAIGPSMKSATAVLSTLYVLYFLKDTRQQTRYDCHLRQQQLVPSSSLIRYGRSSMTDIFIRERIRARSSDGTIQSQIVEGHGHYHCRFTFSLFGYVTCNEFGQDDTPAFPNHSARGERGISKRIEHEQSL
jgi:hypothetical protein